MIPNKDDEEIGRMVRDTIAALLQCPAEIHFGVNAIDLMTPDGMRRAFVMITMNETLVSHLERGMRAAMDALREHPEDGHDE